jgi:hypothetical protein
MRRRDFLGATAAAAATAAWPGWLRSAFADTSAGAAAPGTLDELKRRSLDRGRPLLALVVPRPGSHSGWRRGYLLGALINTGHDDALAALALVDVVCADAAELGVPDDKLAVLFDGGAQRVVSAPAEAAIEEDGAFAGEMVEAGRLLRAAIAPDLATAARRAARVRAAIGPAAAARLDGVLSAAVPAPIEVQLGAALVMERALAQPSRRGPLERALADSARGTLRDHRVPGSKWARSSSCGPDTIEGEPPERVRDSHGNLVVVDVDCGMGFLPERARRFLRFYTKATAQPAK